VITLGVIGYGYWGPNLVRNFSEVSGGRVGYVTDLRSTRLALATARYPAIKVSTDYRELIKDRSVDAVAIATPVSSHFDLAMEALRAGKHVLVEKPMTSTSEQSLTLIDEAEKRGLVLMVDHTFVYTSAVMKMRELTQSGDLGEVYYYDSVRINLGLFQHDVNVLWDLAVHDLSIMDYVLSRGPVAVSATGLAHVPGQPENIAYMTMFFDGRLIAHVHVNWLAPVKVRRTVLGGSRRMILFDDLEASEKIKVYDRGISVNPSQENVYQMLIGYRTGDMWAPQIGITEALQTEARHFIDCVEHGKTPTTDGQAGLRVVRLLEAATLSLSRQGALVSLDSLRSLGTSPDSLRPLGTSS
jgi:predicted dehydrogenase